MATILSLVATACAGGESNIEGNYGAEGGNSMEFQEVYLDINYDTPITYVEGFTKVTDYGAKGDGSTDDTAAVKAALEAATGEGAGFTLYFPKGTYRIASNFTVPLSVTCVFEKGAILYLDEGASPIINGSVQAYLWQVFGGKGSIRGTLNNKYVFPQWFGAKGDGQTDDSAAFQQAIDCANEVAIPATEKGYVIGKISVPSMKRIYGCDKEKTKIIGAASCSDLFYFKSGVNNIKIYNLSLDMSKTGESTCFFFDSKTLGQSHIELRSIDTEGAYYVARDAEVVPGTVYVTNTVLEHFNCKNTRNRAILTKNFWGFIFFRNMTLDNSGLKEAYNVDGNYPAIDFGQNAGAVMQNITIIGTGNDDNSKENGLYYDQNIATWLKNCVVKNTGGHAIEIAGGSHLYFNNLTLENMGGCGMLVNGTPYVQIHNILVKGKGGDSNRAGIRLDGTKDVQVNDAMITGMGGDGLLIYNTSYNVITGLVSKNNGGNGYYDTGDTNTCVNAVLEGNEKAQFRQRRDGSVGVNLTINGKKVDSLKGDVER